MSESSGIIVNYLARVSSCFFVDGKVEMYFGFLRDAGIVRGDEVREKVME